LALEPIISRPSISEGRPEVKRHRTPAPEMRGLAATSVTGRRHYVKMIAIHDGDIKN
jgi:hypothetical protein